MQQLSMNGQVIQTDRKYLAEFHMVTRAKFLPFGLLFTVGAQIPNMFGFRMVDGVQILKAVRISNGRPFFLA